MSASLPGTVCLLNVRSSGLSVALAPEPQRSRVFGFVPLLLPPSQLGQPMEQPLLNQKQDCPTSQGTGPFVVALMQLQPHESSPKAPCPKLPLLHGGRSLSTAFLGGGISSEEWPSTAFGQAASAARAHAAAAACERSPMVACVDVSAREATASEHGDDVLDVRDVQDGPLAREFRVDRAESTARRYHRRPVHRAAPAPSAGPPLVARARSFSVMIVDLGTRVCGPASGE